MAIPVKYRKSPEFIVTYDWIDVANGLGFIDFKGYVTTNFAGTKDYHLGTTDVYSAFIESLSVVNTTALYVQLLDLDFDASTFNTPRTLKGTATINFCAGVRVASSTGESCFAYYGVKVKKWDGTTETDIAAASSAIVGPLTSSGDLEVIHCIPLTIPAIRFEAGETLRITIQGYAKSQGTDQSYCILGNDPQNRDGTYIIPSADKLITKLNFHVPFDIDQ